MQKIIKDSNLKSLDINDRSTSSSYEEADHFYDASSQISLDLINEKKYAKVREHFNIVTF